MPKCRNYLIDIPKFYRWQTFDHIMFGYVNGIRKVAPSTTVKDAILIFLKSFDVQEDDYCFDTAYGTYQRILRSIVQMSNKGEKPDDKTII